MCRIRLFELRILIIPFNWALNFIDHAGEHNICMSEI